MQHKQQYPVVSVPIRAGQGCSEDVAAGSACLCDPQRAQREQQQKRSPTRAGGSCPMQMQRVFEGEMLGGEQCAQRHHWPCVSDAHRRSSSVRCAQQVKQCWGRDSSAGDATAASQPQLAPSRHRERKPVGKSTKRGKNSSIGLGTELGGAARAARCG